MKFKRNSLLFALILVSMTVFAAKVTEDLLKIGNPGSSADKEIVIDVGDGASNPKINVDTTDKDFDFNKSMVIQGNSMKVGDGANTNKTFEWDIGNSPNNPFFRYDSTKSKLVFSHNGTQVSTIGTGSGGGGENFNNAFTADDNANAEDGTTGWTASAGTFTASSSDPLEGEQSFTWTPAAQNNTLDSPVLDVDKSIFYGRACQASIEYIGGDENLSLKVIDADNDEIASLQLQAHGISSVESVYFLCPSSGATANDKDLRLRIENTGASASALIKFDKSYLGTLIGLSESTLPDEFSAFMSSAGVVSLENSNFIEGDCSSNGVGDFTCSLVSGVFSNTPNCVATTNTVSGYVVGIGNASNTGFDVVTFTNAGAAVNTGVWIKCAKSGSDAKQAVQVYKSIPKARENENELTALVNGATLSVISENVPGWVNSIGCTGNTITLNYANAGLTVVPQIQALTYPYAQIRINVGATTTSAAFSFWDAAGAAGTCASLTQVHFSLSKQGADYVTPIVQPILVNQVQTSFEGGARVESCRINNNGTATLDSGSGLCESWIDSVNRTVAGAVTITFKAGIFSAPPNCSCLGLNNLGYCVESSVSDPTTTNLEIFTDNFAGANTDMNFMIVCHGKR